MTLLKDFQKFIARGNVIDLAVAVVIGAAFTKIVTALVDGIIMPIVGAILPGGDWRSYAITPLQIKVGAVLGAIVDFLIVAFVIFIAANKLMSLLKRSELAPPPPSLKRCGECLETIPVAAKRCRACAQPV
jgi:large conductance mechanosensitive channel